MNKITKLANGNYELTCENGEKMACTRWYEKKTESWHVKLPKDNPSGRTYIRESHFTNTDVYEFETKTEHREGMSYGGWRSKLTDEERKQIEEAEKLIETIKEAASKRVIEMSEEDKLLAQMAKLQAKLTALKAQK